MANSTDSVDKYDAITALNSLNSPLLRLPAELRNKIYLYVATEGIYRLEQRFSLKIRCFYRIAPKYKGHIPQWVGLITTCRQLRGEVGLLPYAVNHFNPGGLGFFHLVTKMLNRLHKPVETVHLEVDMIEAYRWSQGTRQQSHVATMLPSLKKVVVCPVADVEYTALLRRFPYKTEERIAWMRRVVRDWLKAVKDEGLEVALVEEEMRDVLNSLVG